MIVFCWHPVTGLYFVGTVLSCHTSAPFVFGNSYVLLSGWCSTIHVEIDGLGPPLRMIQINKYRMVTAAECVLMQRSSQDVSNSLVFKIKLYYSSFNMNTTLFSNWMLIQLITFTHTLIQQST